MLIYLLKQTADMLIVIKNGDKNISLNLINLSDSDKDILNDLQKKHLIMRNERQLPTNL